MTELRLLTVLFATLLCAAKAPGQGVQERGILFIHGNAVGLVQPRCDIALGTQASWKPSSNTIVLATSGAQKQLVFADVAEVAGQPEVVRQKALAIPDVKTRFQVAWQWSFSPNGRWLVVYRRIANKHYWPHGLTKEATEAAKAIFWIGLVDLTSWKPKKFAFVPFGHVRWQLLGWQEETCLFQVYQAGSEVLSIDATNPTKTTVVLKGGFSSVDAVSRDGLKIITYDGAEGDVVVKLNDLKWPSHGQVLLSDPLHQRERRSYAYGGSVAAAFSQDSKWVAMKRFTYEAGSWQVSVSVESPDGKTVRYQDKFTLKELGTASRIQWSPAGPERVFYFRPSKSDDEDTLVVLELQPTEVKKHSKKTVARLASYRLPPLWSPNGTEVVWLTSKRDIVSYEVEKDSMKVLGKLPDDTTSWTWAPPAVTSAR